ncbi:L-aspartate oxidase [Salipaludibacillus sp. HK11]|uniref:L-aspartate oxidase n=1 Tax=Salipaludibacillus sp. HK11 TaxID=3394320 RepID=UPI0039FBBA24
MKNTDVLIIGGGLAAVMCALKLPDHINVTIVMNGTKKDGNSWKAQGGIAAALDKTDSYYLHEADTLKAGCEINNRQMVHILVKEGAKRLESWIKKGLTFDKDDTGKIIFAQEGAHGRRRIVHAGGDQTGKKTMTFFAKQVENHASFYENYEMIDLITDEGTCQGATFLNDEGELQTIYAHHTVLATGGIGGLFQETSNDPNVIGSGIAIANRAGAAICDLEYIQFHPTLIFSEGKTVGLASEALRGEGATLIDQFGNRIMEHVHPLKELAPRDIVARTLYQQSQKGHQLFLEISSIRNFSERFPQITELCESGGVNWKEGKIPVRPGAHFHMGGIKTNENGQTSVQRLYAIGEVAGNGVHGANRLASNSLLEAIVFGERTGEWIANHPLPAPIRYMKDQKQETPSNKPKLPEKEEIRQRVSDALGVVRKGNTIEKFMVWVQQYNIDVWMYRSRFDWHKEEIQTANMLMTAYLTAQAALANEKSCGAHFRVDEKGMEQSEQSFVKATVG